MPRRSRPKANGNRRHHTIIRHLMPKQFAPVEELKGVDPLRSPKRKKRPSIGATVEYKGVKGQVTVHKYRESFEAKMVNGTVYLFLPTDDWKEVRDAANAEKVSD